jgi:hypothetical protein
MSRSRSLYCHSDTGPTGPTALILRDRIRSSLSRPFILVLPSRPFILVRDCFQDYLVAFENASEITWLRSKRRVSEFFAKCRWKRTVDRRHKRLAHRVGKVRVLSFSKECSSLGLHMTLPDTGERFGVLPGSATGSHIVDRGTPVAPLGQPQLNVPERKSHRVPAD